jgi:hypothetical protein
MQGFFHQIAAYKTAGTCYQDIFFHSASSGFKYV